MIAATGVLCCLAAPVVVAQEVPLTPVGTIPGPVQHIRAQGDHLFVSSHTRFSIWDVSDAAAPREVGALEFPEEIWGFRVRGDRAYVGNNFAGVGIVDISDPTAPAIISSHKTLGQTKIGAVWENRVVAIDHMEGLVMVDITDEAAPTGAGSFFLDGYARDVVTSGHIAYATDSPTGLYVFDLSASGEPEPVGVVHAPGAPRAIEVQREVGEEPSGILVGAGAAQVQIYDASDPTAPVRLATHETPGRAARVAISGDLVFVADTGVGVTVVDISDPAAPTTVGSVETDMPARDIAASERHVFVVVGAAEGQEGPTEIRVFSR